MTYTEDPLDADFWLWLAGERLGIASERNEGFGECDGWRKDGCKLFEKVVKVCVR